MSSQLITKAGWTDNDFLQAYKTMWRIRIFEETIQSLYLSGCVHGTLHLCIGQEATAVGGAGLLRKTDWLTSTHRNHGHCIAKGVAIRAMLAEILGKATGTNGGRGGSMHIADEQVGCLSSNGIVGAGFPLAAGAALTAQMQQTDQVVLCYSGDGATNEGSFHEALNLASIWKLPVIYFVENNHYGMSSSIDSMINIEHLSERAASYGIVGKTFDGNDLIAVLDAMTEAIQLCQSGQGPVLLEALTYRHCGHSKSDQIRAYRSRAEEVAWAEKNDPIMRLRAQLIQAKLLTDAADNKLQTELYQEMDQLVAEVMQDPEPAVDSLLDYVYAE